MNDSNYGHCLKCGKPYHENKITTDGDICECYDDKAGLFVSLPTSESKITEQLKEIRQKAIDSFNSDNLTELDKMAVKLIDTVINSRATLQIQSETYKLGRNEVIKELAKIDFKQVDEEDSYYWDGYAYAIEVFKSKLDQLITK